MKDAYLRSLVKDYLLVVRAGEAERRVFRKARVLRVKAELALAAAVKARASARDAEAAAAAAAQVCADAEASL